MSPLLLTPVEAAAALGVGRSTVFRLIQTGALASVRIGVNRRIRVADLADYVAGLES